MGFTRAFLFVFLLQVHHVASEQKTTIEGRLQLPDMKPFNTTTTISLNFGDHIVYSAVDGSFQFRDVPPGVHVLDVHSKTHHFPQIKIQIVENDMENPRCLEYAYPGAQKNPVLYPLVLTAIATYDHFEIKRGFSIFSILKNPMLLMMLFGAGLMFVMPKLVEQMDPEEKEQMRKQMEMQQDPTKMLSSLFGMGEDQDDEPNTKSKKLK